MFAWIAFFFSALTYLHNDVFIDFADEGFLWYGALKTFQGQVPLRDFQSYFPGRYYFTAAFFNFLGPNLLAVRIAGWTFQALALILTFRIAKRASDSTANTLLLGVLTVLWMILPCRYFDSALVIAAVFFAVRLLENPTNRRHFTSGIFTGVALFFGINHGWYAFVIFQTLVVLNGIKTRSKNAVKNELTFLGGVFAGCLPLLLMALFVPGFGTALTDYIALTLSRNNDVPLPWSSFATWSQVRCEIP